jgi:hypothetical protein
MCVGTFHRRVHTDDALNVATTLADALDKIEILVLTDLLDTDEHGC